MSEYAERDIEELEQYYLKHICAMTVESLHGKSAIAAELAFRDFIISELHETIKDLRQLIEIERPDWRHEEQRRGYEALAKARGES